MAHDTVGRHRDQAALAIARMSAELRSGLGALLDQYDEARRAAQARSDQAAAEGAMYLEQAVLVRG